MSQEHVLDGVLAHAASTLGLVSALAACHPLPVRRSVAASAAGLLGAGVVLQAVNGTLAFTESLAPSGMIEVLTSTTWGRCVWVLAAGSAVAGTGAALGARRLTWVGVTLALAGLVWLGHGSAKGDWSALALLHAAHVGAVLAWAGGLLALFVDVGTGGRPLAALRTFSRRALLLALVAFGSGVLLSVRYVPGPGAVASPYGLAWGAKATLALAVAASAWWNRRLLRSGRSALWERLDRGLFGEVTLFVGVLAMAAVLSQLEPPR